MEFIGILTGLFALLMIGLFHPLVIKCEYYFTEKIWPLFLIAGIAFLFVSLFLPYAMLSCMFGITGITCLWSIGELKEQTERVKKGLFPENPNRKPPNS